MNKTQVSLVRSGIIDRVPDCCQVNKDAGCFVTLKEPEKRILCVHVAKFM